MIVNDYFNQFKNFAEMDHRKSWVSFQSKSVIVNGKNYKVLMPVVGSKPTRFLRWIYKIFDILTGYHFKKKTAKNLFASVQEFKKINALQSGDNLLHDRVMKIAVDLLKKFEKHKYCKGDLLLALESPSPIFSNPSEKIKPSKPILENTLNVEEQLNFNFNSSGLNIGPSKPILGDISKVEEQLNFNFSSSTLEKKAFEVNSFNWNDSENSLLDPIFTTSWVLGDSSKMILSDKETNQLNENNNHNTFISFLQDLTFDKPIKDHYNKVLSPQNVDRLKKMMFAIMNSINKGDAESFNNRYIMVVEETCRALNNCSNAMNTAIENLFYDIHFSNSAGGISQKVSQRLQKLRDDFLRESIQEILNSNPYKNEFYLKHAAATYNYYYGKNNLCSKLGLPSSVSSLDAGYKGYALQGQESKIMELFNQKYTSERITDVIYGAICDVNDTSIPTALFTDWVMNQSKLDLDEVLEEDTGQYKKSCVTCLLENLEIIKPQE